MTYSEEVTRINAMLDQAEAMLKAIRAERGRTRRLVVKRGRAGRGGARRSRCRR